jgi:hypothetical protein
LEDNTTGFLIFDNTSPLCSEIENIGKSILIRTDQILAVRQGHEKGVTIFTPFGEFLVDNGFDEIVGVIESIRLK